MSCHLQPSRARAAAVTAAWLLLPLWTLSAGCQPAGPRQTEPVVRALFDPDASQIPMPTDILRDDFAGRLDLPVDDDDTTPAERELYQFMNTLEGWSPATEASVEFSAPLDPDSLTRNTVQVWEWQGSARRRLEVALKLKPGGAKLLITPPEAGWTPGTQVVVLVVGGARGVRGAAGEPVTCDAAFYYLRQRRPLTDSPDYRAFPGETRSERKQTAEDLEEVRRELQPLFEDAEQRLGVARDEVAALWTFTIHDHTVLLMDKERGKMPLPIDLLLDPVSGKVDIPVLDEDSETVRKAKWDLRAFDGFGTTMDVLFELSAEVDAASFSEQTVQLYRVDGVPAQIPITVEITGDGRHGVLRLKQPPLAEKARYAVVLRKGVRDQRGRAILPMLPGRMLMGREPLWIDGQSQIGSVEAADALKLETSRQRLAPLLDVLGRDNVALAWPFSTMSILEHLQTAVSSAERLQVPADPQIIRVRSALSMAADFPLGALTVSRVKQVVEGKIATPDFLDPETRAFYKDGGHRVRWIDFIMTIPDGAVPAAPLKVVLFGHGITNERRFMLAAANALAKRGFAAIAVDWPYHGTRTHCAWDGPICFPNPLSSSDNIEMICPKPCAKGATCAADGTCRDANGNEAELATWPVIPYARASGAAFIELSSIGNTRHHFLQALADIGALSRVVQRGNWAQAIGYQLQTHELYFAGQSLGSMIGGIFCALEPKIHRAVLNVPGANMVPMFRDSLWFRAHLDHALEKEGVEKGSNEYNRFLNTVRWFTDSIDILNVAPYLTQKPLPGQSGKPDRAVLIQMATLDFVIPNAVTELLAQRAGVPRMDYIGEHNFLVIPVEPAHLPGAKDMAEFLEGSLVP